MNTHRRQIPDTSYPQIPHHLHEAYQIQKHFHHKNYLQKPWYIGRAADILTCLQKILHNLSDFDSGLRLQYPYRRAVLPRLFSFAVLLPLHPSKHPHNQTLFPEDT